MLQFLSQSKGRLEGQRTEHADAVVWKTDDPCVGGSVHLHYVSYADSYEPALALPLELTCTPRPCELVRCLPEPSYPLRNT